MKKIMNKPETAVMEMCQGLVLAHPELELDFQYKIIKRKEINTNKVTLISGGGSGHEPAHAGFVGKGMLDAAVCGDVFASPSQMQVYRAICSTKSEKGTLLIIKNYSGDLMNFKNAAYLAQDETEVDYIIVNDDIAVKNSLYTVGRRGVAGTVLVHKIAGAAAERGYSLEQVKVAAQDAVNNIRSIGVALSSCTVPAKGTPTFEIAEDEMEYGVGIHGEPGIGREKIISADELAKRMVHALADEMKLTETDEITLLVNGFGGTPLQELYILNNSIFRELEKKGIRVYHCMTGNYMTSIDMQGCSLTFMKMNDHLKELLAQECVTPGLTMSGVITGNAYSQIIKEKKECLDVSFETIEQKENSIIYDNKITMANMKYMIDCMGTFIIKNEIPFCELDSHAGDGDFGMSIAKGFRQLKREWSRINSKNYSDIGSLLKECAFVIMEHCGGASGPIWGSAFFEAGKSALGKNTLSVQDFSDLLKAAVDGIQKTGERSFGRGAVMGDKTLMDALIPCMKSWEICNQLGQNMEICFQSGASLAKWGAKETEKIVARMGRAGTVGERSLGYPDAGAYALGEIFAHICEELQFK